MEELEVTRFQIEKCSPDKEDIWSQYPFYILHFVFRGSGFFNGQPVGAGQMFLIRMNELATWKPDPEDPWEYGYVNASGRAFEKMLEKIGLDKYSTLPFRFPRQTEALFRLGIYPTDRAYHADLLATICQLQITPQPEKIPFEIKVSADQEFYDDPKTLWEGGHGQPIQYVDGYGVGFSSLNDQVIFRGIDFGENGANKMVISFSNGGDTATLDVYVDKKTGSPAATFAIPNTGGYESAWAEEFETDIRIAGGVHDIIVEFTNSNSGSFYYIRFSRTASLPASPDDPSADSAPRAHLKEAAEFIESKFGRTTAAACAEHLHLSRSYLNSLFDRHYGQSLQSFIISRRMNYASSLLRHSRMTVTEIAALTGYRDPLQFSKAFRKRMGKSPRAYRKEFFENGGSDSERGEGPVI